MRSKLIILLALICLVSLTAQPKIIFDTDFGGDADDLGALVMLNNFMMKGECELIAVMCWSTEKYAVPAIDAVNRFHNKASIPIGVRKDSMHIAEWNYGKVIANNFESTATYENVANAIDLYRNLLAESKDSSIIIVTVGPLKNIQNLLDSKADNYSTFSGKELIDKKVKEFVIMGGKFPEGEKEWNFDGGMPGVTKYVLANLKPPITFSGFELGVQIKTGEVFNEIDHDTPLYLGFKQFSESAPWMKEYYKGKILDNSTYDQTAVLYAVRGGVGEFWERIEGGYCMPDETGGNRWIKGEVSNHSYLKLLVDPEEIEELIEAIMLNDF